MGETKTVRVHGMLSVGYSADIEVPADWTDEDIGNHFDLTLVSTVGDARGEHLCMAECRNLTWNIADCYPELEDIEEKE